MHRSDIRRAAVWLLLHAAALAAVPILAAVVAFCFAMAILTEGPLLVAGVDWAAGRRWVRHAAHVAWAGWSA